MRSVTRALSAAGALTLPDSMAQGVPGDHRPGGDEQGVQDDGAPDEQLRAGTSCERAGAGDARTEGEDEGPPGGCEGQPSADFPYGQRRGQYQPQQGEAPDPEPTQERYDTTPARVR